MCGKPNDLMMVRLQCLSLVATANPSAKPSDVLARAKKYEAYVTKDIDFTAPAPRAGQLPAGRLIPYTLVAHDGQYGGNRIEVQGEPFALLEPTKTFGGGYVHVTMMVDELKTDRSLHGATMRYAEAMQRVLAAAATHYESKT